MSDKITKEAFFLKFLLNTNEKQQQVLIKTITKRQISVVIEIMYNVLYGNLNISSDDINKLKRYKTVIRKLVSKGLSLTKRKDLLLSYYKQILILIKPYEKWLKN